MCIANDKGLNASQLFNSFMKSSYLYFSMGQYYMKGDGGFGQMAFLVYIHVLQSFLCVLPL